MKSKIPKAAKKYHLIDCREENLGRLATRAARILQGKHRPDYQPNVDAENFVAMINCETLKFSGGKEQKKKYHSFSGYPGGITTRKLADILKLNPEKIVKDAVYGMLPKNKLRDGRMKRLLIFKDSKHGLESQLNKKT